MYDVIEMLTLQHISKHSITVTMSKDTVGSTVQIISVTYSKLIKSFKKLKMGDEDFER